ncbi:Yip1 family protein [Chloroflexus sp.]|uniref:Yip1 family protein n=1 Tax=Chloroflexus sp. TaxID=1904827 RepID=UPI002ADDE858|nr:Yip1 family protein [Chloroflexus sp.]
MESLAHFVRLSTAGLLLDVNTFRAQRDNPYALREGFLVVIVVGVIVGIATLIGNILSRIATPDPTAVLAVLQRYFERIPLFSGLQEVNPDFSFDPIFDLLTGVFSTLQWSSLIGAIATPLVYVLGWLIYGTVAHLAARSLGGDGTFAQTLGCTALASGANLLAAVQIIPFATVAGTTLLGLIGCYLGLRAAHNLPAWRAFWATLIGPILLILILLVVSCGVLAILIASAQGS